MKTHHFKRLALFFCLVCICAGANAQILEDPDMWLMVERDAVGIGKEFAISVHLDPLSQTLGAYTFNVTYDPSALEYVNTASGPDGFPVFVVNATNPGKIVLSAFDVNGKSPSRNMNIAYFTFRAMKYGITTVRLETESLVDLQTSTISVLTPNPKIDVKAVNADLNFGDVDDNGSVQIIDALNAARYGIGIITSLPNVQAGDVNGDFKVDIVDALLIAQDTVGLGMILPITRMLDQINAEFVPVYPKGIPPAVINPASPALRVKFRDTRGAPIADRGITFSGGFLPGEQTPRTDANGLVTAVVPIEAMTSDFTSAVTVKYGGGDYDALPASMSVKVSSTPLATALYLTPAMVSLTPTVVSPTHITIQAVVTLSDGCKAMSLWGTMKKDGNNISVDTTSYQFNGMICTMALIDVQHNYDLYSLPAGTYTFTFSNWGTVLKTVTFVVPYVSNP